MGKIKEKGDDKEENKHREWESKENSIKGINGINIIKRWRGWIDDRER